jgi:hypothetical protein
MKPSQCLLQIRFWRGLRFKPQASVFGLSINYRLDRDLFGQQLNYSLSSGVVSVFHHFYPFSKSRRSQHAEPIIPADSAQKTREAAEFKRWAS